MTQELTRTIWTELAGLDFSLSTVDAGGVPTSSLQAGHGDETIVFLDYGGPASLVAKVDAEEGVAVGDRRRFAFRRDKLVLFDREEGGRIA